MSRFAFVTWDGGGNVPPAVGVAQELVSRGHDVVFIGYDVQRAYFEARRLPFVTLPRSGHFDTYALSDPTRRIPGLMANVWAAPEHLDDVPDTIATTSADVVIVDFTMHGALVAGHRTFDPIRGSGALLDWRAHPTSRVADGRCAVDRDKPDPRRGGHGGN